MNQTINKQANFQIDILGYRRQKQKTNKQNK